MREQLLFEGMRARPMKKQKAHEDPVETLPDRLSAEDHAILVADIPESADIVIVVDLGPEALLRQIQSG